MTATGEDESINNMEELIGAVGRVDESVAAEHLSDVKWRDADPLFVFNNDNVMKPQTLTATSTPIHTCEEEDQVVFSVKLPLRKNLLPKGYLRWLQYALNLTMMTQN